MQSKLIELKLQREKEYQIRQQQEQERKHKEAQLDNELIASGERDKYVFVLATGNQYLNFSSEKLTLCEKQEAFPFGVKPQHKKFWI